MTDEKDTLAGTEVLYVRASTELADELRVFAKARERTAAAEMRLAIRAHIDAAREDTAA